MHHRRRQVKSRVRRPIHQRRRQEQLEHLRACARSLPAAFLLNPHANDAAQLLLFPAAAQTQQSAERCLKHERRRLRRKFFAAAALVLHEEMQA